MTVPRFLIIVVVLIGGLYGLSLWLGSNRGEAKQGDGFAGWLGRMSPQKKIDPKTLGLRGCTLSGDTVQIPAGENSPGITIPGTDDLDAPRMLKITLPAGTVGGWTIVYHPLPPKPGEKVKLKDEDQTIFDQEIILKLIGSGGALERSVTIGAAGGELKITRSGDQAAGFTLH